MKTIAQQLNIKQFPFFIKDKNGNELYYEESNGSWVKREVDENDNEIHYEDSDGYWAKHEYNELGQEIYYETSIGTKVDKRPKAKPEYTMEQLVEMLGEDFKLIK